MELLPLLSLPLGQRDEEQQQQHLLTSGPPFPATTAAEVLSEETGGTAGSSGGGLGCVNAVRNLDGILTMRRELGLAASPLPPLRPAATEAAGAAALGAPPLAGCIPTNLVSRPVPV